MLRLVSILILPQQVLPFGKQNKKNKNILSIFWPFQKGNPATKLLLLSNISSMSCLQLHVNVEIMSNMSIVACPTLPSVLLSGI